MWHSALQTTAWFLRCGGGGTHADQRGPSVTCWTGASSPCEWGGLRGLPGNDLANVVSGVLEREATFGYASWWLVFPGSLGVLSHGTRQQVLAVYLLLCVLYRGRGRCVHRPWTQGGARRRPCLHITLICSARNCERLSI